MTPDSMPPPAATLDLTGLPAETIRQVRAIADAGRRPAGPPAAEPPHTPFADPSPEEFALLLAELTAGPSLPPLPPDWSRADLYDDHD